MRTPVRAVLVLFSALSLVVVACGSDADDPASGPVDAGDSDAAGSTAGGGGDSGGSSAGAGSLTLGGETIELGPGRCFLQEQPAAAGGGSILATAQAMGTNAAGEEVRFDFSRYSEDSDFAGDDVNINIGPLGDSEFRAGSAPLGTVSIDGSVVSATDFPLNTATLETEPISFTINC